MQRHFLLLAIAISFELNNVASRSSWCADVKVSRGRHRAKKCSQCPCDKRGGLWEHYCNGIEIGCCTFDLCFVLWIYGDSLFYVVTIFRPDFPSMQIFTLCSEFFFKTKCNCRADCQWRGDLFDGGCQKRKKLNKGE